jgi:hypothetical protein
LCPADEGADSWVTDPLVHEFPRMPGRIPKDRVQMTIEQPLIR